MSGGLSSFADALAQDQQPQDTYGTATYLRTDSDGTAWVRLVGSDIDTPANGGTTVDAQEGDIVTVRQDGTRLYIMGNGTTPAVGERQVTGMLQPVQEQVEGIVGSVGKAIADSAAAQKVAEAVAVVAEAVAQHFWTDDSGVHVTQVSQEAWEQTGGEHYHSGPNVLINALGQLFRDGLNNLLTITTEGGARALTVWDGLGNAAGNIRAIIGEVIQLGKTSESHAEIDYHSLQLIDKEGATYFYVSDLRDATGYATITDVAGIETSDTTQTLTLSVPLLSTDSFEITGVQIYVPNDSETIDVPLTDVTVDVSTSPYVVHVDYSESIGRAADLRVTYKTDSNAAKAYTLGLRGSGNIGAMSVAEGHHTIADGGFSHAEGRKSHASGIASHAEGRGMAYADYAHSEGYWTYAGASCDHAEGTHAYAEGGAAHAEGDGTHAYGQAGHAEGIESSTGRRSRAAHAQNLGTIAASDAQTAMGRYNANDPTHALEVGNGSDADHRSNALTVDWDGTTDLGPMPLGDSSSGVHVHGSNVSTTDETASSGLYGLIVGGFDSGNALRSYLKHVDLTNGNQGLQLETRRSVNGSNVYHGVQLLTNGSGTRTVQVSDQAAWRSGLGLGSMATKNSVATTDLPTVPTSKGGTGVTAKQASTVSLNNSAASTNHAWHNGVLATVTLGALHVTSALSSGSSRNVGTVPAGYRPSDTVWVTGGTNADASTGKVFIAIASSGAITLYNRSGASLGTGVNMYFTATYAI